MDIKSLYEIYLLHPAICTDTRKIKPGCLYVALKGFQYDGNSFANDALKAGAAYAIVSDRNLKGNSFIYVDDTLTTLQSLANFHRRKLAVPLVAITGSNGKTTTKELITRVLSEKFKVHSTIGNLNNHIGVPLTLLGTPTDTEIIICEMGANHIGEIAMLCEIAMPSHGLITNIGKAHLEGFGSIRGVQQGKGELYEYLRMHSGFVFVNADDPLLIEISHEISDKTSFGFNSSSNPDVLFNYSPDQVSGGFEIREIHGNVVIHSGMFGFYNASNVLAAYTLGIHFNVSKEKMVESLSTFVPGANRSEMITYKGNRIIKDAYNANPTSMELSLRAFAQNFHDGWVILGDMKELGDESDVAHQQILRCLAELGLQHVILVGKSFESACKQHSISFSHLSLYENIDALIASWDWGKFHEQTLLLKGSRSMYLEKLLEQ